MDELDITYALSKQIPDMERGFTISTSYGDLVVEAHEAAAFVEAANLLMFQRLAALRGSKQSRGSQA